MLPSLAAHYGADQFVGSAGGTRSFAGSCSAMTEVTALPVEDHGDWFVDEFGARIRRGAEPHVERPALTRPSLRGYRFPDLLSDAHYAHLDGWCRMHADRFRIVQLGSLLFERTWSVRGMQNFFIDFHENPAFAHDLLDHLEAVCCGVIDYLLANYGDRIDAIGLSEDYGSQQSLLIGPPTWRAFLKPHLGRIVERIRAGGKQAYLHSCGHILPIIGDLIDVGVSMLQPIQPEAMDIFEVKRRFGRDVCLMGGISTQRTLPYGTVDEVRREIRECLRVMAVGGGYVMAPAKPIMPGVPVENAIALIDAFTNQEEASPLAKAEGT